MFIPLGTDRPLTRPTVVNHALMAANLIAFGACLVARGLGDDAFNELVLRFGMEWKPSEPWRLLTYTLLHQDGWHIAGNMLFLWVFGPAVEDRLGRAGYLGLYVAGAAAAGAAHALLMGTRTIGASGAVAAVLGAFIVLFPRTHIKTFVLFFRIGVFDIPAAWFIGFAMAVDLLFLADSSDHVARLAHLGGYAVGVVTALALLISGVLAREPYDAFSLFKHGRRRQQIREAAREAERRARAVAATPGTEGAIFDAVAEDRAAVSTRLAAHDVQGAMRAYRTLLERHAKAPGAASLSRRYQLEIANAFFNAGDHATAMSAYERFLEAYPGDPEAAHVKLLMGLIAARYLHQPDRARTLIADARPSLHDEEQLGLAQQLLTDLRGGRAASG